MGNCFASRQLAALLFAALTPPVCLLCAGLGWQWVLLAAVVAGAYYGLLLRRRPQDPLHQNALLALGPVGGRIALSLMGLFLLCLLGYVAGASALAFPETKGHLSSGLVVLLLAAMAAKAGPRVLARCGVVLFLAMGVIYAVILAFSLPDVSLRWLAPSGGGEAILPALAVFFLPTLGLYVLPDRDNTRLIWWWVALGLFAVAVAALVQGCLSPALAGEELSFYQLSRSVSLFGVMERFEVLVSAAWLAGFFCLSGVIFVALGEIAALVLPLCAQPTPWLFAAAAGTLFLTRSWPLWVFALGSAVFCGVFPLGIQFIVYGKKMKKN